MRILSAAFTLVALGLMGALGAGAYVKREFEAPGRFAQEIAVEAPKGASVAAIARRLEEAGAIADARMFRWGARLSGADMTLKAGEYALPPGASMAEILALMAEGKTIQHKVTAPEGLTSAEIVAMLLADERLVGALETIPPEGALAPDTYFFHRGEARQAVLDRMRAAQSAILNELWAERSANTPVATPEEALILASIVEKETGVASERPLVAGVFANRLKKGMRLQSDPTVIYGVTKGAYTLDRGLKRSELDAQTPYNTYVIKGLPPTPIANPGRDAITAVINPAETKALYFVADGTGGHAFAETLDEHNRNVRRWRALERGNAGND